MYVVLKKKKGKKHQTEHSDYILCNMYFFLTGQGLHHPLRFLSAVWTGFQEEVADSVLRSTLTNLSPPPQMRDEQQAHSVSHPPLEADREETEDLPSSLRTPVAPSPHVPARAESGQETEVPASEHSPTAVTAVGRGSGACLGPGSPVMEQPPFLHCVEIPPLLPDSLERLASISGISPLFPHQGVSSDQPPSFNYCHFIWCFYYVVGQIPFVHFF